MLELPEIDPLHSYCSSPGSQTRLMERIDETGTLKLNKEKIYARAS